MRENIREQGACLATMTVPLQLVTEVNGKTYLIWQNTHLNSKKSARPCRLAFISETDQTQEVDGYDGTTITELLRLESEFSKLKVRHSTFQCYLQYHMIQCINTITLLNFHFQPLKTNRKTRIIYRSF